MTVVVSRASDRPLEFPSLQRQQWIAWYERVADALREVIAQEDILTHKEAAEALETIQFESEYAREISPDDDDTCCVPPPQPAPNLEELRTALDEADADNCGWVVSELESSASSLAVDLVAEAYGCCETRTEEYCCRRGVPVNP